jgi:aspartyl-tRNA(Asn)/glutamyl-tRNA(Gln) amidotransferase subunit A
MALSWTLDKLGPMARTADDCALVLAAISGRDRRDETALDQAFTYTEKPPFARRARLGVPKGCVEGVQPEVRAAFEAALAVLARTCDVTRDVEWPDHPWGPAVSTIVAAEGAAAFIDLIESGRVRELRCPSDRVNPYSKVMTPAVDYLQAMRARKPMKRAMAALFEKFDALVTPTRATVAYPADQPFAKVYTDVRSGPATIAAGNLCGLPALAVPIGFGANALPVSMAIMGAPLSERVLVELGKTWQAATDWHTKRPPVA